MDELIKAAIPAILNDEQAKKALLDYINALTDKVRPQEEWRQVWWRLSDDIRQYNGRDNVTGIENPGCRLYVEVQYSWRGIGQVLARYTAPHFDPDDRWGNMDRGYVDRFGGYFHKETFDVKNFVEAIEQGQSAWNNVHEKWMASTLPVVSVHVLS